MGFDYDSNNNRTGARMNDDAGDLHVPDSSGLDLLGGSALGALLGLLVGLSATPVITGVIAGIVALLGGVFGVSDKLAGPSRAGLRRLTAFALAAMLVAPLSIWMRTHDTLGMSVEEHHRMIDALRITDPVERLEWMKFLRYGIMPANAKAIDPSVNIGRGVLYNFLESSALCRGLYALDGTNGAPDDFAKVLSAEPKTSAIRMRIAQLPDKARQLAAYQSASIYLCGVQQ